VIQLFALSAAEPPEQKSTKSKLKAHPRLDSDGGILIYRCRTFALNLQESPLNACRDFVC